LIFANPLKKILLNKLKQNVYSWILKFVPLNQKEAEWPLAEFTLLTDKFAQTQAPAL